jgi:hypothetical protein
VLPGFDGALQAVRDPFAGGGRTMQHPLNEDPAHPLSVSKGYATIYAPGTRIANALGKTEDLVTTWAEDADAAHKMFPGKIDAGEKLYLERPNKAGLSAVRKGDGSQIMFMPGQDIAISNGQSGFAYTERSKEEIAKDVTRTPWRIRYSEGLAITQVPLDPKEAAEFFRKNLGPGWYVQRDGYDDPKVGQGYTLYYGGRLKVGEAERDAMIEARGARVMQFRQDARSMTGTVDLPEGAAIRYTNATGSASAAKAAGTSASPATRPGLGMSELASKAAKMYGDAAEQQREILRLIGDKVVKPRIDNAKGLFE